MSHNVIYHLKYDMLWRTFFGQTGPKKVRIYTEKSEFYHFPLVQRLFNINKLSQQLYKCNK